LLILHAPTRFDPAALALQRVFPGAAKASHGARSAQRDGLDAQIDLHANVASNGVDVGVKLQVGCVLRRPLRLLRAKNDTRTWMTAAATSPCWMVMASMPSRSPALQAGTRVEFSKS
jgi:hypothetical protein